MRQAWSHAMSFSSFGAGLLPCSALDATGTARRAPSIYRGSRFGATFGRKSPKHQPPKFPARLPSRARCMSTVQDAGRLALQRIPAKVTYEISRPDLPRRTSAGRPATILRCRSGKYLKSKGTVFLPPGQQDKHRGVCIRGGLQLLVMLRWLRLKLRRTALDLVEVPQGTPRAFPVPAEPSRKPRSPPDLPETKDLETGIATGPLNLAVHGGGDFRITNCHEMVSELVCGFDFRSNLHRAVANGPGPAPGPGFGPGVYV